MQSQYQIFTTITGVGIVCWYFNYLALFFFQYLVLEYFIINTYIWLYLIAQDLFFLASLAAYGCKLLRKCLVQLPVFQYDFNTVFYICLSAYIVILFHNLCCRSHRQTFQEYYFMPHIVYISLCMYCNGDGCCCNQFCAGGFNINCSCFVLQPRQRNYLVITAAKKGVTADAQPSQYARKNTIHSSFTIFQVSNNVD